MFESFSFGLSRFFGGWSGLGVDYLGCAGFFILTFLLPFRAYGLLPWVRRWVGNGNGHGAQVGVEATGTPEGDIGSEQSHGRRPKPASVTAR